MRAFLSGNGQTPLTHLQLHLLNGWKPNTLNSYNSAVNKFLTFYQEKYEQPFVLPATATDIYEFCITVGRTDFKEYGNKISAKTLTKYLFGLQAWHLFHSKTYPHDTKDTVKVILRASGHADALFPPKPQKPAVLLQHLLALFHSLRQGSQKDLAILDCAIVAFWGLARLAELTYDSRLEPAPWASSVLASDAIRPVGDLSHVILLVRGAKTAKPGETQRILLNAQPNCLCPVQAVRRRLSSLPTASDALFSYVDNNKQRNNLTRSTVVNRCRDIWKQHGWDTISGHSFRVGGASLCAALGVPHADIKTLGRWTTSCYKLYLREYSNKYLSTPSCIIQMLNHNTDEQSVYRKDGLVQAPAFDKPSKGYITNPSFLFPYDR